MKKTNRILLVEDDKKYRFTMKEILMDEGYDVHSVEDPILALEVASKKQFDLLLSDLRMEPVDGIRLSKSLKKIYPRIKTLILTGEPDDETEIAALDTMIDGYLSKDKSSTVIIKYIQTLLKGEVYSSNESRQLISPKEGIIVEEKTHDVYKDEEKVSLTNKEYELLRLFLRHKNESLSREYIQNEIWGEQDEEIDENSVNLRAIDVLVKRLRVKLSIYSIVSLRGFGYKWNE